jgi:DNA-directed RNA polymerase specialized sigma24 family protein
MVLGVCLRVLSNEHDSEDAFQATFLVLVRKARSIRKNESLANWLYSVALRTALKARSQLAARRTRERELMEVIATDGAISEVDRRDLRSVLDKELCSLPLKLGN